MYLNYCYVCNSAYCTHIFSQFQQQQAYQSDLYSGIFSQISNGNTNNTTIQKPTETNKKLLLLR